MTDRHGGGLGRDAGGRRRRRVVDPAAARSRPGKEAAWDPAETAANVAGWPEQAGSRSGEFTLVLVNQVSRALFMGEDPRLQAIQPEAAMAALEQIGPCDPIEGMLGAQMIAAHDAAMLSLHLASRNGVSHELRDRPSFGQVCARGGMLTKACIRADFPPGTRARRSVRDQGLGLDNKGSSRGWPFTATGRRAPSGDASG